MEFVSAAVPSHVLRIPAEAGIQSTFPLHEHENGFPVVGFAAAGNERKNRHAGAKGLTP
jgi:hypothetical protein